MTKPYLKTFTQKKGRAKAGKSFLQMYLSNYRKKGKYHNVKQEFGGRKYDSKLESKVAQELEWRKKAGEIKEIIPQFKIDLRVNGMHITNYFIDFKCIMADGSIQFIEAKGFATEAWKLKFKLTQALINEIEPGAELLVIK